MVSGIVSVSKQFSVVGALCCLWYGRFVVVWFLMWCWGGGGATLYGAVCVVSFVLESTIVPQ